MNVPLLRVLAVISACGLLTPALTYAECSEAKIKTLSRQGKTIASIAKSCDMEKTEVQDILEGAAGDDKLPPGSPLGTCGCWGPVAPQARRPAQECTSGIARPQMCPGLCPMGGAPWRDVCAQ